MIKKKCTRCNWFGEEAELKGGACPSCGMAVKDMVIAEVQEKVIEDIPEGKGLWHDHGERYMGYYLIKTFIRKETLPLGRDGLSREFNVSKNEVKFILPPKIEFSNGTIYYTDAERRFGMFRFPRNPDGSFRAPLEMGGVKDFKEFSEDDLKKLMKSKKPLVFEAYRIPFHGFEYFDLSDTDLAEIAKVTDRDFADSMKSQRQAVLDKALSDIRRKIDGGPNYLLILQNCLNQVWTDYDEISRMTNNIIHI